MKFVTKNADGVIDEKEFGERVDFYDPYVWSGGLRRLDAEPVDPYEGFFMTWELQSRLIGFDITTSKGNG